ncbi:MAG: DUF4440 domain-containing protein [Actinomycetota bacterium]
MDDSADWVAEIVELHDRFQAYFRGEADSLDRVAAVLAEDFRIVDPRGGEHDRQGTLAGIGAGHGRSESLTIETVDHRLVLETGEVLIASYVEQQTDGDLVTRRLSTVVFRRAPHDAEAPNGLVWVRVHETWEPGSP